MEDSADEEETELQRYLDYGADSPGPSDTDHNPYFTTGGCYITIIHPFSTIDVSRVRMRRDFLDRLIEKYFEQLIDSVRVYDHIAVILRQTILINIVPRHAPAHARHTCNVLRQLMNRCTK